MQNDGSLGEEITSYRLSAPFWVKEKQIAVAILIFFELLLLCSLDQ